MTAIITKEQQTAYARRLMSPLVKMNPNHDYEISPEGSWNFNRSCQERILKNLTTGKSFLVYSTNGKTFSIANEI